MAGKRFGAEQIIMKLREAEVGLAQGQRVGQMSKQMGVSEQTCYRWRKEYGGLQLDQAKRLKVLEKENALLHKSLRRVRLSPMGQGASMRNDAESIHVPVPRTQLVRLQSGADRQGASDLLVR